jgi:DHA2 family multidrug resistance protein-like MFS transporter
LHFSQAQTGLLMTPWPVGLGIMAPVAGRLSDRMPAAVLGGVGMAILALGLGSLALLPAHAGAGAIVWRMAVCGLGFGFFQSPNNRTMLTAAPRARAGAAGGMLATARLTGMTIGATLAAVVFHLAAGGAEPVELFVATGCAVAAGGASLLRLGG